MLTFTTLYDRVSTANISSQLSLHHSCGQASSGAHPATRPAGTVAEAWGKGRS